MSSKISVDKLTKAVEKELTEWRQEVSDGVKSDVKTVSRETVQQIKATSPKDKRTVNRKGRYARGWRDKVSYEDSSNIRVTIYNSTDYQLAHLLEFGHEIIRGGKVVGHADAIPHIRPAEQAAEEKLMKKVIVRVRKG